MGETAFFFPGQEVEWHMGGFSAAPVDQVILRGRIVPRDELDDPEMQKVADDGHTLPVKVTDGSVVWVRRHQLKPEGTFAKAQQDKKASLDLRAMEDLTAAVRTTARYAEQIGSALEEAWVRGVVPGEDRDDATEDLESILRLLRDIARVARANGGQ